MQATDSGTDDDSGAFPLFIGLRGPAGVFDGVISSRQTKDVMKDLNVDDCLSSATAGLSCRSLSQTQKNVRRKKKQSDRAWLDRLRFAPDSAYRVRLERIGSEIHFRKIKLTKL